VNYGNIYINEIEGNGGVLFLFIFFWGHNSKKNSWRFPYAHHPKDLLENLSNYE
jgi:hypothetical protein